MKRLLLSAVLLSSIGLYAQVGINQEVPKATLDIEAKKGTTADGLLIPRLSSAELKSMTDARGRVGQAQNGLMVYVKDAIAAGQRNGKYANIDQAGYYYYDSTADVWKKLGADATGYIAGKGIEIRGNRINTQGLEKLTEGSNTGWRLTGRNAAKYGNIGSNAIDLSYSDKQNSNTYGATGEKSVALGEQTTASAELATAMGWGTIASGKVSVAIGDGVTAKSYRGVALGSYNTEEGQPEPDHYNDKTRRLLIVGNGTGSRALSDAVTVLRNGKVGIGIDNFESNNNDNALLQVNGLIQSRTIANAHDANATKLVTVTNDGTMKSIEIETLFTDLNNKISSLEGRLAALESRQTNPGNDDGDDSAGGGSEPETPGGDEGADTVPRVGARLCNSEGTYVGTVREVGIKPNIIWDILQLRDGNWIGCDPTNADPGLYRDIWFPTDDGIYYGRDDHKNSAFKCVSASSGGGHWIKFNNDEIHICN